MPIIAVCPLCVGEAGKGTLPVRQNGSPGCEGLCGKCAAIPEELQGQIAEMFEEINDLENKLYDAKYKMRDLLLSLAGRPA